ncbi:glycosyltransferase family 4 protein [Vibrio kyushuensis]|uniref:glycosyltransferase family 4 protein n=1 Tax=Vibrio kyushuensis TaxID=2910249 RepID=UPI003D14F6BE
MNTAPSDLVSSFTSDSFKMKKVWLLIDSLAFGGIETHVFELANGLKKFDIDVSVVFIAHYGEQAQLADKLEKASISYFYLNHAFPSSGVYQSLKQAILKYQPNLIHAHGYKASIYSRLARKLIHDGPFKQISTFHAGETPKGKVWLYDFIDRYSAFFSDARLSVSQLIKRKLPSHSYTLNNFIDTTNIDCAKGSQIAFVGRLSHEKAPDRFLNLAIINPEHEFHCYGSGPMECDLISRCPSNLTLHGHQSNMESIWKNVDLLVIPSRYEGLPMAGLEAMARGIPLLCTNVGDLSELIEHQNNGFIVDNEGDLQQQLQLWLLMSECDKQKIRHAAKQTIEQHYSTKSVLPQLLDIYQI